MSKGSNKIHIVVSGTTSPIKRLSTQSHNLEKKKQTLRLSGKSAMIFFKAMGVKQTWDACFEGLNAGLSEPGDAEPRSSLCCMWGWGSFHRGRAGHSPQLSFVHALVDAQLAAVLQHAHCNVGDIA